MSQMELKIHLDRLLVERRMSLAELSDRVGIPSANLQILKSGRARAIRMASLLSLCRELDCQPGDLFSVQSPDLGEPS